MKVHVLLQITTPLLLSVFLTIPTVTEMTTCLQKLSAEQAGSGGWCWVSLAPRGHDHSTVHSCGVRESFQEECTRLWLKTASEFGSTEF